jgi:CRP-like cAMP-binding protein
MIEQPGFEMPLADQEVAELLGIRRRPKSSLVADLEAANIIRNREAAAC